jgi:hypothetical protein
MRCPLPLLCPVLPGVGFAFLPLTHLGNVRWSVQVTAQPLLPAVPEPHTPVRTGRTGGWMRFGSAANGSGPSVRCLIGAIEHGRTTRAPAGRRLPGTARSRTYVDDSQIIAPLPAGLTVLSEEKLLTGVTRLRDVPLGESNSRRDGPDRDARCDITHLIGHVAPLRTDA